MDYEEISEGALMDYDEIKEAIRAALQNHEVPKQNRVKDEVAHVKSVLEQTNKRLDDTNAHILDQSRRIDSLRGEVTDKIQTVHDQLMHEIQGIRTELKQEILLARTEMKKEIQQFRLEYKQDMQTLTQRVDSTNDRLDRVTMAMVRREEQERLLEKVSGLEMRLFRVEEHMAA